ncbi:MAG: hypothetical protein ACR2PR_06575 [Pseudohongiellaceae bacterium]
MYKLILISLAMLISSSAFAADCFKTGKNGSNEYKYVCKAQLCGLKARDISGTWQVDAILHGTNGADKDGCQTGTAVPVFTGFASEALADEKIDEIAKELN